MASAPCLPSARTIRSKQPQPQTVMEILVDENQYGVQKHFNDLEIRIRDYGLTLITATLAGAGLVGQSKKEEQQWLVKADNLPANRQPS